MQKGPISIENKDNQYSDKTLAEQENRIPSGMSETLAPNAGNHCIPQDHILQADSSSNILKQKNNGELMVSDTNQNFNCPFTEAVHDKSLQKSVSSTKQIETSEGSSICINKEPDVESSQSNSGEGNFENSSSADVSGSNEVQREVDVQEDENLKSISSFVDSVDPASVSSSKSSGESDNSGNVPILDRGHLPISSKARDLKSISSFADLVDPASISPSKSPDERDDSGTVSISDHTHLPISSKAGISTSISSFVDSDDPASISSSKSPGENDNSGTVSIRDCDHLPISSKAGDLKSISSFADLVDPASISSSKSQGESNDCGTISIRDRAHLLLPSKVRVRIVKFLKARSCKKNKKISMEKFAIDIYSCKWKLADDGVVENFRSLYMSNCSWLDSLKDLEFPVRNYKDYVSVVKVESLVALAFNREKISCLDGVPLSRIFEEGDPSLCNTELSDLMFCLAHSPLYTQENGVWKKCFAVDGMKEESNWQGILYMRQIWANLKSAPESRCRMVKFFLSNSPDKSADGVAKSVCKDLHIPHCYDMVEKVFFTLQDLEKRKEVIRVTESTSSALDNQSSEGVTMKPAPSVTPSSANLEGSTKISVGISPDTTSSIGHGTPTVHSRSEQCLQHGSHSSLMPVEKNDVGNDNDSEASTKESQSSVQISGDVAENEKSNVSSRMDSEKSDECIPNQSAPNSAVDSTVKELSETTLSLLRGEQVTFGIAKTSKKSGESLQRKNSVLGVKAKKAATLDVNLYINEILKETGNVVPQEVPAKQDSPSSSGKKKPLEIINIKVLKKETSAQKASHSSPVKKQLVKIRPKVEPLEVPTIQDIPSSSKEKRIIKKKIKFSCSPQKRKSIPEGTADDYFMPMAGGWVREVVTRGIVSNAKGCRADVYYHPPQGKKLRSSVEVMKYLSDQGIPELSMKNFTFRKEALGFGPPYELLRGANISGNFFKKKGNDTLSPETPVEDLKPPKRLKTSPASDNITPSTKSKKKGEGKKSAKKTRITTESLDDANESQAGLLNESWGDEVDITNEVGETTGYEGWIASKKINQSSTPTKAKPAEPKKRMLIESEETKEIAEAISSNSRKRVEVESNDIPTTGNAPDRVDQPKPFISLLYFSKSKSKDGSLKYVVPCYSNPSNRKGRKSFIAKVTPSKSSVPTSETGNSQTTDIPKIMTDRRDTVTQDKTQVPENPWIDILENYEKRKIIRERNKHRKVFNSIPKELQRFSDLIPKTANTGPDLRLFPESEKQATTSGEKSGCRIRVRSFSELAEIPDTSKNLNNTSERFVNINAQTPVSNSSVPGGLVFAPGSGSENIVSMNSLGQGDPQLQRPMIIYSMNSQNNQVPTGAGAIRPHMFRSVWQPPVGSTISQSVTQQRLPANRFSYTCSATPGAWTSSKPVIVLPYTPVRLLPPQQGALPKTQTISKLPENSSSLRQINPVSIQQSTSNSQATFSQLPTNATSFPHQGNKINTQTSNNFGYTGYGFYKEQSTTDDGVL